MNDTFLLLIPRLKRSRDTDLLTLNSYFWRLKLEWSSSPRSKLWVGTEFRSVFPENLCFMKFQKSGENGCKASIPFLFPMTIIVPVPFTFRITLNGVSKNVISLYVLNSKFPTSKIIDLRFRIFFSTYFEVQ